MMSDVAPNPTQDRTPERVTRCVVLQAADQGEPEALLEALRRKPVRIDMARTPARAMAEIARHEIEFRHRAEKEAHRRAEAERTGGPVPDVPAEEEGREPLVLLAVDPEQFEGEAERMSGSVAHYFPQVVQWVYRTGDEPRLEPWHHPENERVADARTEERPRVETRATSFKQPAAVTAHTGDRPSLRLTSTDEGEPDSIGLEDLDEPGSDEFDDGLDDTFGPPPLDPPNEFASADETGAAERTRTDEDLDDLDEDLAPPLVSADELAMLLDDDDDDDVLGDEDEDDFHGGFQR